MDRLLAHPWFGPCLAALLAVPLALLIHRIDGLVLRRLTRHTLVLHGLAGQHPEPHALLAAAARAADEKAATAAAPACTACS